MSYILLLLLPKDKISWTLPRSPLKFAPSENSIGEDEP
jgi:hypothetical protein